MANEGSKIVDDAPSTAPPLRKYEKIPLYVLDAQYQMVDVIYKAIHFRRLPDTNIAIIHLDSHPNLNINRFLNAKAVTDRSELIPRLDVLSWMLPVACAGYINKIAWIKPPWVQQISDGVKHFQIGTTEDEKVRVNSPEPYFLWGGLFCPSDKMDNKKDIVLSVGTMDLFEDRKKDGDKIKGEHSAHKVIENIVEALGNLDVYILDVDLCFFSTRNPFKSLAKISSLNEMLKEIYRCSPPDVITEAGLMEANQSRERQLDKLDDLFAHLEINRNLDNWPGERDHLYTQVSAFYHEMMQHYKDRNVEWYWMHTAGCTLQDMEPYKVLATSAIRASIVGPFRSFLRGLPTPPTIITISRSSPGDLCPPRLVSIIKTLVLEELQEVFNVDKPHIILDW